MDKRGTVAESILQLTHRESGLSGADTSERSKPRKITALSPLDGAEMGNPDSLELNKKGKTGPTVAQLPSTERAGMTLL